jgi:hypothetical protein
MVYVDCLNPYSKSLKEFNLNIEYQYHCNDHTTPARIRL